ncbi:MAG: M14 family zinc carboxypeptidase, partial [Bacteroidetes bacterium]|nr:M14 family zinc carboxypeptidase [Bacteroidota bacterium]
MKHKLSILFILLFIGFNLIAQSTTSPESFFGYKVGSKFTRHHQVLDYFKALAKTDSSKIKLEKYGETYEGRELMLAYISSAENIANLKNIQENNLALVNNSTFKIQNSKLPTIVWLSYNVHGNEPASTEAAMLTAYELLNPSK